MTIRRLLLAIPLAVLFLAPIVLFVVDRALTVYATPEMQTRFLRDYAPDGALDKFRISDYPGSTAGGIGAGAGLGFATHVKTLDQEFLMRSDDRTALMAALDRDVASRLDTTGAKVISETGNDTDGIRLSYVAGKSTGTVTIKPLDPISDPGQYLRQSLGAGEEAVWVRIRIEETWFKSGIPMPPAKVSLLSRLLL
jgi:hypothetical protein